MTNISYGKGSSTMPEFMRWGGPGTWKWSFGWWTGPDKDLICIIPKAETSVWAEIALSPVCSNRVLAVLCFGIKWLLLKFDENAREYI